MQRAKPKHAPPGGSMKRILLISAAILFAMTSVACDSKKGGGGDADGDNPFAQRKAHIEAYFTAIEAAADPEKAGAAGQAWLDANKTAYVGNCTKLIEYRGDLKKSKMAKGHNTDYNAYMGRIHAAAKFDPKKPDAASMKAAKPLMVQFGTFFQCDAAVKALK
ncbi:MAG: hypothetical protein ACI9MR_002755 [Myxococcota bacterium]|jgi:hypothetical protein